MVAGEFFTEDDVRALAFGGMTREVSLAAPAGPRHYLAFANCIRSERQSRLGCVFGFFDISEQKGLERELLTRTAELTDMNARLAGALTLSQRLETERARRAAVEEVHATLGRRIEGLIAAIDAGTGVDELINGCRVMMAEIRSTVAGLSTAGSGRGRNP